MEIAEFRVRCFVCWKRFSIPAISELSYGTFLFVNYKTREFRSYSRISNPEIETRITAEIHSDAELKSENDTSKGNLSLKLIGKLSDGDFEPIFRYVKCPRCNIGFHSYPNSKIAVLKIGELTFQAAE
jgi:hypothetical protein